MKTRFTHLLGVALLLPLSALAQTTGSVGIGTSSPSPKAALDISASDKGLLIPRMDSASRAAISTPPDGLMVFQTDGRKGFWYAIGGSWLYIPDKTRSGDNLGNHAATQSLALNDFDIRPRSATDTYHGLGWYGTSGTTKNWLAQDIDGPVLYGNGGGVLGTNSYGYKLSTLYWNNQGNVGIGTVTPATRLSISPGITEAKITLWDGGDNSTHYGLGVSGGQLNYHVDLSNSSHVFYAGGKNGNGTELMRIKGNGRVGIGQNNPQQQLHVGGNIAADGALGLLLAPADRPLVTRTWDAFTSGNYQGAGRWGVFMEPSTLAFGIPSGGSGRGFKWQSYNANSTVASTLMALSQDGNLQLAGSYGYTAAQTRYLMLGVGAFISADPGASQAGFIPAGPTLAGVYQTGTGTGSLLAPIQLPQGATITNIELTVYDNDGTTSNARGRIVAVAGNPGTGTVNNPYTAWVTVPDASGVVVRNAGAVSMGVDNSTFTYFAEFQSNRNINCAIISFRVTYTVTQAN